MSFEDDDIQGAGLSYKEKSIIMHVIVSILLYTIYSVLTYRRYLAGDTDPASAAQFFGRAILLLIVLQIVIHIVTEIGLAIATAIANRKEPDPSFADERDKLIELKGTRNTFLAFGVGFILAMIALAVGMTPLVALILIFLFMMIGDITGELSKLGYYRRGI